MSFGELKAAAAGNSLLLRQHELQVTVRKLRLKHVTARQNVNAALHAAAEAERRADTLQSRAQRLAELLEYRPQLAPLDLSRCAYNAVSGNGHRARWSSGPLVVEIAEERGDHHVNVHFGYRALWTQLLPAKVRRQGRRGRRGVAARPRRWMARRCRRRACRGDRSSRGCSGPSYPVTRGRRRNRPGAISGVDRRRGGAGEG